MGKAYLKGITLKNHRYFGIWYEHKTRKRMGNYCGLTFFFWKKGLQIGVTSE